MTPGALPPPPQPLYWRFLRLHYVRPNGWQRALLVEGVFGAAAILALADAATAWTVLALPLASAAVVKANDVVAGMLPGERVREPLDLPQLADYLPFVAGVGVLLFLRLVVHGTAEGAVVALAYGINTGASLLVYRYTVRRGLPARVCVRYAVISFAFGWLVGLLTGMIDIRRRREA
ncbi:MAG: hypothetical protein JO222_02290 [Frankiales bacterium]|nr:hypothetical protein [Frankiales bacterium]